MEPEEAETSLSEDSQAALTHLRTSTDQESTSEWAAGLLLHMAGPLERTESSPGTTFKTETSKSGTGTTTLETDTHHHGEESELSDSTSTLTEDLLSE